jgi:hypothetical protein
MGNEKKTYTRTELEENFWDVQKELGRQPSSEHMNYYGKIHLHYYSREYGKWSIFLGTIGLAPIALRKIFTDEELIAAFWECHHRIGKQPSFTDLKKYGKITYNYYLEKYGNWSTFLAHVGLESIVPPKLEKELTWEVISDDFENTRKSLGRVPHFDELPKYGRSTDYLTRLYKKFFGGWTQFLEDRNLRRRQILIEEATKEFFRLKKELGRIPTIVEFGTMSAYWAQTMIPYFGSWNNFVRSLGEKPNGRGGNWQRIPGRKKAND